MSEATTTAAVPRFFVETALRADATLALPADVARHAQVLRLQPGDALALFDGSGGQYRARLVEIDKRSALAQIEAFDPTEAEPPYRVTLAQGIAGGDKMDWVIEKAVELGVAAVVPLSTARGDNSSRSSPSAGAAGSVSSHAPKPRTSATSGTRLRPHCSHDARTTPRQCATRLSARSPDNFTTPRAVDSGTTAATPSSTAFSITQSILSPPAMPCASVTR